MPDSPSPDLYLGKGSSMAQVSPAHLDKSIDILHNYIILIPYYLKVGVEGKIVGEDVADKGGIILGGSRL